MSFDPISTVRKAGFVVDALKVNRPGFWSSGSLVIRGKEGQQEIVPFSHMGENAIEFKEEIGTEHIKLSLTDDMIICGEYSDEVSHNCRVVFSGPKTQITELSKKYKEQLGYIVV